MNQLHKKILEIWKDEPLFLDTETTGLGSDAEIVEICILGVKGDILLNTLVKPRRPIPPEAIQIHGITNQMVMDAPYWSQVWGDVKRLITGKSVGIYNAEFDLKMMRQSHAVNGMVWKQPAVRFFCIMRLFSDMMNMMKWFRLEEAGRRLKISLPNSHRAYDDTLLARQVFIQLARIASMK